jgi:hypothetical protein
MKSEAGPPMTLGSAAAAQVRLIVWCRERSHQVEPDPAEIEDFLEGFNQSTYRGMRINGQRVATWSSQHGWSGM